MKGFTFYELLITVIVIGILATFSIQHYSVEREKSLDAEAHTKLALLIQAEREYFRSQGSFYASNDQGDLNFYLAQGLPSTAAAANRPWTYSTEDDSTICCAQATRTVAPVRNWRLCCNEQEPVAGTCGAGAANCPGGPCI